MKIERPEVPVRLGGITQAGLVVGDLERSMERYWRLLGIGPWRIYTYAPPRLRDSMVRGQRIDVAFRIALAEAGPVGLELIQPLEGPSIHREFLETRGEGMHHLQSPVENIEASLAAFQALGIDVLQSGRWGEGEFYYLDTERLLGFPYEIYRRRSRPEPDAVYPPA
jgi:hypothetical protein